MNKITNTLSYDLLYEQFKKENIYAFEIKSKKNSLILNQFGFTNLEGIENLKQGKSNIKRFYYNLLSEEELKNFADLPFDEAYEKIELKNILKELNSDNYNLYILKSESHNILSYDEKIIFPKFIYLNNPLYLLNNVDFNLEEIQDIMSKDKRFVSRFKSSVYEKEISNKKDIIICNIPYYNKDSEKDQYINVGFKPTNEDWNILINLIKENNIKIDKSGYINNLSQIIVESGILGFTSKNKFMLKK